MTAEGAKQEGRGVSPAPTSRVVSPQEVTDVRTFACYTRDEAHRSHLPVLAAKSCSVSSEENVKGKKRAGVQPVQRSGLVPTSLSGSACGVRRTGSTVPDASG